MGERDFVRCGRCGLLIAWKDGEIVQFSTRDNKEKPWESIQRSEVLCRDVCWPKFRAFLVAAFAP